MKKLALAAVIAGSATTAFAGNTAAPIIEPTIVTPIADVEQGSLPGSGGLIVPLIIVALIAAAVIAD